MKYRARCRISWAKSSADTFALRKSLNCWVKAPTMTYRFINLVTTNVHPRKRYTTYGDCRQCSARYSRRDGSQKQNQSIDPGCILKHYLPITVCAHLSWYIGQREIYYFLGEVSFLRTMLQSAMMGGDPGMYNNNNTSWGGAVFNKSDEWIINANINVRFNFRYSTGQCV